MFQSSYNNHSLRTEGGYTPLQLFVQGFLQQRNEDRFVFEPSETVIHDEELREYGIDPHGPIPAEDVEQLNVPPAFNHLTEELYSRIIELIDPSQTVLMVGGLICISQLLTLLHLYSHIA